ncbi:MAG: DUF1963 domain-containing protein [Aliishimia sp.]
MSYLIKRMAVGQNSTSWLGGVPKMPADKWPRSKETGLPMHFLAQIDLATISDAQKEHGLPEAGWFCFFADTEFSNSAVRNGFPAKLIYIRDERVAAEPPSDIPKPYGQDFDHELEYFVSHPHDRFHSTFVELQQVSAGTEDQLAKECSVTYDSLFSVERDGPPFRKAALEMRIKLENALQRRPILFSKEEIEENIKRDASQREAARQFLGMEGQDFKIAMREAGFYTGHKTAKDLIADEQALTMYEQKLREAKSGREMLQPLLTALSEISDDGEAYDAMSQSEFDYFVSVCEKESVVSNLVYSGLERHMRGVLAEMAFGDGRLVDKLPETIRRHWNKNPNSSWGAHVFLGSGSPIQELPENLKGHVPLLHLSTDTILGFKWGDMGVIQFWIPKSDLENHHWEDVKLRMAGH